MSPPDRDTRDTSIQQLTLSGWLNIWSTETRLTAGYLVDASDQRRQVIPDHLFEDHEVELAVIVNQPVAIPAMLSQSISG